MAESAELGEIVLPGEVEVVPRLLVDVPEDIETDGVHPESLAELDSVFPVWARDSWVVQFGSLHDERLSVKQESLVSRSEAMSGARTRISVGCDGDVLQCVQVQIDLVEGSGLESIESLHLKTYNMLVGHELNLYGIAGLESRKDGGIGSDGTAERLAVSGGVLEV